LKPHLASNLLKAKIFHNKKSFYFVEALFIM